MADTDSPTPFHIHLVSDATGETIHGLARACLAQFEGVTVQEHLWPLVRTEAALRVVVDHIEHHPGLVLYTMVNTKLRTELRRDCARLGVRAVSVLEPVMRALQAQFGTGGTNMPGRQHVLDAEYFHRIEAMDYVMNHDDGQAAQNLEQADVVLVGVSRTSKTPTSIYLANRGVKVANVPIVPGVPPPPLLTAMRGPLIVGLTNSPRSAGAAPPQSVAHAEAGRPYRLHRPRSGEARSGGRAQAVHEAWLAGDRRDAPLDRGNGGGDPAAPRRASGSGRAPEKPN